MSASSFQNARYRVDKFIVPAGAREEFLAIVGQTHAVLRAQKGFVRDHILEQESGPGAFNLVTIVEWADSAAIEGATAAVKQKHAELGIDPRETVARLGITPDVAIYGEVVV